MRILYHHRTRAEDAQGVHIRELIDAFRKLNHQVEVAGIVSPVQTDGNAGIGSILSRLAAIMPHWIYELLEISYNIYGLYFLKNRIPRFRPDFIYERYALYTFAGVLASKVYGIPLILEVNAPLSLEKARYSRILMRKVARKLERWICSNSHRTVVVSTTMKNMLKDMGVPERKLIVISNGIDPKKFNPGVDGSRVHKKYNLNGKFVLGFVGWFRKWHGLEDLLRVYVQFGMLKKNIHIFLIGNGPAFRDLQSFAQKHNILNTGVTFSGAVDRSEIPQYIATFDLALQPDVTEYASPIKIFEYMGMAKGIIAPNKENIIEILGRNYDGLFSAGDWNAMGKLILWFSDSRNRTKDLGNKSYDILQIRKYFWSENARRTLALLSY
jgi:glycosyltransferase involved in cell wall biosynthesis